MEFNDFNLEKTGDGLLPVIIQDARTLKVLMLGYMNREAFEKTRDEGRVTFFSRSKQRLWTKGETSGNFLTVKEMFADCDGDTLLIKAIPAGPTCHRGTTACFDTPDSEGFVRKLMQVVKSRHEEMPDGSYTTKLFIQGGEGHSEEGRRGVGRGRDRSGERQARPLRLRGLGPHLPFPRPDGGDGGQYRRPGGRAFLQAQVESY